MIILKFGGTSVSTSDRIHSICELVRQEQHREPVVVVSAIRGITDLLLSLAHSSSAEQPVILAEIESIHVNLIQEYFGGVSEEIQQYLDATLQELRQLSERERTKAFEDETVSFGECLSSFIISHALQQSGIAAAQVKATELIVTDSTFGNAEFLPEESREKTTKVLLPLISNQIVPVVTGFIGATEEGETTTLGRGGSDYSAAIIGYCMNASEIQIWTDVDGIFTADPRIVSTATRLPNVSFREAAELAAFGAKVLHPRTLRPAISSGIPVRVLNTLNRNSTGTLITATVHEDNRVTAIASKNDVTLLNLYSTEMLLSKGFLERIFAVFAAHGISVDLVSVSEVSVSVTLDNDENLASAVAELETFTVVTIKRAGVVSVVGEGIVGVPHLMRQIFSVLDHAHIRVHMISFGASDINMSFVLDPQNVQETVLLLHDMIIQKQQIAGRFV